MKPHHPVAILFAALLLACGTTATSEPPDPSDTADASDGSTDSTGDSDPGDSDPGDSDPGDSDPGDSDPGDSDPGDSDPGDSDPGDSDPGDSDPGDSDPGDSDPGDSDPGDGDPRDTDPGDTDAAGDPPADGTDEGTAPDLVEDSDPVDSGCEEGSSRPETLRCPSGRFAEVRCTCVDGVFVCPTVEDACRDRSCDDGGEVVCAMARPTCEGTNVIPAIIGGCWECVDADTCRAPVPPVCADIGGFCSVGPMACPEGSERTDRAVCLSLGDCCLPSASACSALGGGCYPTAIECPFGFAEGGGEPGCATGQRCCVPDEGSSVCDDGTEWICDRIPPVCDRYEIRAIQDGCAICVNPATCRPWGEPGCASTDDCEPGQTCDGCGSSSCPFCDDCVAACVDL